MRYISIFQKQTPKGIWKEDECCVIASITERQQLIRGPKGELALLTLTPNPGAGPTKDYAEVIAVSLAVDALRRYRLPIPAELTYQLKGVLGAKEKLALNQFHFAASRLPSPPSARSAFDYLTGRGKAECEFSTGQSPQCGFHAWAKALTRARNKTLSNKRRRTPHPRNRPPAKAKIAPLGN